MRERREEGTEWLEERVWPLALVEANLSDIARMGRWMGLTSRLSRRLARWAGGEDSPSIVEVGCGRGDLALAIARRLRRRGSRPRFLLIDRNPQVLACAREFLKGERGISLLRADARALPLREGACEWALCVQLLHQFEPEGARGALAELDRVARRGVLVADVRRSRLVHFLVRVLMRIWGSPLTRHDAPLSIRRAYTLREAKALARGAKLDYLRARRCPPAHWALLGRRVGA